MFGIKARTAPGTPEPRNPDQPILKLFPVTTPNGRSEWAVTGTHADGVPVMPRIFTGPNARSVAIVFAMTLTNGDRTNIRME